MYQPTKTQTIELITLAIKPIESTFYYCVTDRFGKIIIESTEDTKAEARRMAIAIYEQNPDAAVAKVNGETIARKVF